MEVVIPNQDFDFTTMSALSSPYSTAPPTPRRFGEYFYSAPTSPSRMSDFYRAFDDEFSGEVYTSRSPLVVPYEWQYNPASKPSITDEGDFAFEFSRELERTSLSADELFDGGKIKPLEPPPPRSDQFVRTPDRLASSRSPRSPSKAQKKTAKERGRERVSTNSAAAAASVLGSNSGRRTTRSLSPLRVSKYPWEEDCQLEQQQQDPQRKVVNNNNNNKQQLAQDLVSKPSKSPSKKWRLRDFLLFRSASEGRATDKDPLRKYSYSSLHSKKHIDQDAAKIRSADGLGSGSGSGSGTRRKGAQSPAVSAHERHYTANKAASEGMKKKTFLPYKQGILGRLAFNPAVHALSNGFGSFTRS